MMEKFARVSIASMLQELSFRLLKKGMPRHLTVALVAPRLFQRPRPSSAQLIAAIERPL
jgi:hypothetical protein